LPMALFAIMLAIITFNLYERYGSHVTIAVGNQNAAPQVIYFGTEYHPNDPSRIVIPLFVIAGAFFTIIALTFLGLGQVMRRAFDGIPNRVAAYTTDVLGSLTGIASFAAMSFLHLSPHFWFLPIVLLLLYFSRPWTRLQVISAIGITFMVAFTAYGAS